MYILITRSISFHYMYSLHVLVHTYVQTSMHLTHALLAVLTRRFVYARLIYPCSHPPHLLRKIHSFFLRRTFIMRWRVAKRQSDPPTEKHGQRARTNLWESQTSHLISFGSMIGLPAIFLFSESVVCICFGYAWGFGLRFDFYFFVCFLCNYELHRCVTIGRLCCICSYIRNCRPVLYKHTHSFLYFPQGLPLRGIGGILDWLRALVISFRINSTRMYILYLSH